IQTSPAQAQRRGGFAHGGQIAYARPIGTGFHGGGGISHAANARPVSTRPMNTRPTSMKPPGGAVRHPPPSTRPVRKGDPVKPTASMADSTKPPKHHHKSDRERHHEGRRHHPKDRNARGSWHYAWQWFSGARGANPGMMGTAGLAAAAPLAAGVSGAGE